MIDLSYVTIYANRGALAGSLKLAVSVRVHNLYA